MKAGLFRLCGFRFLAAILLAAGTLPVAAEPIAVEVAHAEAGYDRQTNEPVISFRMSEASARLFADFTSKNVGRKIEMRVDGQTIISPVLRSPILGGAGQLTQPSWTPEQARNLAERLSSGAAKLEVEVVD